VLVPSSAHAIPIGELDPVAAAPLADAALTPYHAIAASPELADADAVVAVLGVGGLGHLAVQILEAVTAATVIAVDVRDAALELALSKGAEHAVRSGPGALEAIRSLTGGRGCDVVLDFVGADATLALGAESLRVHGALTIVGSGGGTLSLMKGSLVPRGVRLSQPYWGGLADLEAVVALARRGAIGVETEPTALDDVDRAVERLRAGRVRGRVVLVP